MAEGDNQLEIEVALRDSTSTALKEISRQLDTVSKKMVETGKTGQEAFEKIGNAAKKSAENTKSAHAGLSNISGAIGSINKVMMGAGGLIALFAGFSKVLGNFAAQRVQMQLLTTDIGFTTQQISIMKQVLAQKGITDEGESKAIISGFGAQFKEAQMLGEFSPMFERFARYGNVDLGEKIVKAAKSNDFKQAMDLYAGEYERLAKTNPARARYFATVVAQTQELVLQDWLKLQQGTHAVQEQSYFDSKEFLKKQEEVYNEYHTLVNKSLGAAISGILGIEKAYSNFANTPAISGFLTPKTDAEGNADVSMMPGVASEGGVMPSRPSPKQQNQTEGRASGGPAYSGRSYLVGERGPEMFSPSESGVVLASYTKSDATVRELTDTEREFEQGTQRSPRYSQADGGRPVRHGCQRRWWRHSIPSRHPRARRWRRHWRRWSWNSRTCQLAAAGGRHCGIGPRQRWPFQCCSWHQSDRPERERNGRAGERPESHRQQARRCAVQRIFRRPD